MANSFYCRTCNIPFEKSCNCTTKCPKCNGYNIVSTNGYDKLLKSSTIKCLHCDKYTPAAIVNNIEIIYCIAKQPINVTELIECPLKKW